MEQRQWSQVGSSGSTLTGRKRRDYCTSRSSSGAEAVEPGGILWFHTHREEEEGGAGGGEVLSMGRDVNNLGHTKNNQMYK